MDNVNSSAPFERVVKTFLPPRVGPAVRQAWSDGIASPKARSQSESFGLVVPLDITDRPKQKIRKSFDATMLVPPSVAASGTSSSLSKIQINHSASTRGVSLEFKKHCFLPVND